MSLHDKYEGSGGGRERDRVEKVPGGSSDGGRGSDEGIERRRVRFTDGSWARTAAILARINAESESVVEFLFIV